MRAYPDPWERWRLVLGRAAEGSLDPGSDECQAADAALSWLYDRDGDGDAATDERRGGAEDSMLSVPEWINQVHTLFPREVIERLETDAVERFGIDEVVTNLEVLRRLEPSLALLRAVLQTRHLMNPDVLAAARTLVARVVQQIMDRLETQVRQAFSGTRDRRRRTRRAVAADFNLHATLRANLHRWHPERRRLYLEHPLFDTRTRRRLNTWDIVLLVDQSGSMVDSVIHSAVLASCLWSLPGMRTHLVAFDTNIVDLTADVDDPVELLMKVQLGGGTLIGKAVAYAAGLLTSPHRSIVVVISDFYEGGDPGHLLREVRRLVEAGVNVIGLAALDQNATPVYDHDLARRLVELGMPVAAMTPGELAGWLAGQVNR